MGNHLVKFKRALALVLAFVMTVSVLTVAPSTEVSAASSKYVSTLKVSSSKFTLTSGKKKTIKATVKTKGSSVSKKVTVSLSAADKKEVSVKVGKPSKKGVTNITIKAKTVTSKKTAKVKVTTVGKSKNKKKIVKTVTVTVKPAAAKTVAVTAVNATIDPATIEVGSPAKITATVVPANATDKTLTYVSNAPTVAAVTQDGAVVGLSAGSATITVKASNGVSTTVNVVVTAVKVTKIEIPATLEVGISGSEKLTATVTPENATDKTVKWSSKDTSIATVDQEGNVTGVAAGETEVYATSADGSVKATCKVTVKEVNPDGITLVVTNPYEGAKRGNTVLVGDEMVVRARVTKDGKPQGNKTVIASLKFEMGNDAMVITSDSVQTTDANGYANFVVGEPKNANYKVTNTGAVGSYTLTATEASSNVKSEIVVNFAAIKAGNIDVLNNNNAYDEYPNLVPAEEAEKDGDINVGSMDGIMYPEYVYNQQVSSEGVNHKVYISRDAALVEPAQVNDERRDAYEQKVDNGTSGPANIYYDKNSKTTIQVTDVPAGLKYITLKFDKINLSKYTYMGVDVINANDANDVVFSGKFTSADNTKLANSGIQIEKLDEDVPYIVVVYIVSAGQVDSANEGYVLTGLVGEWATKDAKDGEKTVLPNAVTWENVSDKVIYQTKEMTNAKAQTYFKNDLATYYKEDYKYSYKVPTFPYVGNAVITVKDSNNEVKAYFTYPTYNVPKTDEDGYSVYDENDDLVYTNTYDIQPFGDSANAELIKVTEEEVTRLVGSLTTDGNMVVVDSTETGVTSLKGTLKLDGVDEKTWNDQNGGVLYTSVHWAPIPAADDSSRFLAMEDQLVEVIAQIYDRNGNTKSISGQSVTFAADTEGSFSKGSKLNADGGDVVVQSVVKKTDAKGQAKLVLAGSKMAYLNDISASCGGYDVKLIVGNSDPVYKADISWVDMGLKFDPDANKPEDDEEDDAVTNLDAGNKNVAETAYTVGETWYVGFLPVGEFRVDEDEDNKKEVTRVEGVTVDYNKKDSGSESTLTEEENTAIITSKKAGTTSLEGRISGEFDSTKVVFHYGDNDSSTNVGTGKVNYESTKMTLPIQWKTDGITINAFSTNGDALNENTPTWVVIKVEDTQGNAMPYEEVALTVESTLGAMVSGDARDYKVVKGTPEGANYRTNGNGILAVQLNDLFTSGKVEPGKTLEKQEVTTVTAEVVSANGLKVSQDVSYKVLPKSGIAADFNVTKVEPVAGNDKQVKVYFNESVNEATVSKEQFTVRAGVVSGEAQPVDPKYPFEDNAKYTEYKVIDAVRTDSDEVTLTLDKSVDSTLGLYVFVSNGYNKELGILDVAGTYELLDVYGRMLFDRDSRYIPGEEDVVDRSINVTYDKANQKLVVTGDKLLGSKVTYTLVIGGINVTSDYNPKGIARNVNKKFTIDNIELLKGATVTVIIDSLEDDGVPDLDWKGKYSAITIE